MDVIASRVTKHPLLQDMNYEDIISMTVDVLRQVKIPASYVEKSCYKNIEEFKAEIPLEALNIRSVDYVDDIGNLVAMVKASDTRAKHISKTAAKTNNNTYHYTYFLNNNRIHCNVEEGKVFIIYDTLELDSEGLPMIPDNISLIKAIENYIKASAFRVYADLGKITRETEVLTFTPEERYERLWKRSPHLFQLVPQKYIASYLGMKPETLSRVKRKRQLKEKSG